MTTAPTAAQMDTIANSQNVAANCFFNAINANSTVKIFLAGYTESDNTTVSVIQLISDPTSDLTSAEICRGLVSDYTNILVREYSYVYVFPTDVTSTSEITTAFIPDSTEQSRVNNPSNWVAAP